MRLARDETDATENTAVGRWNGFFSSEVLAALRET
jgi:hypothetical protein